MNWCNTHARMEHARSMHQARLEHTYNLFDVALIVDSVRGNLQQFEIVISDAFICG